MLRRLLCKHRPSAFVLDPEQTHRLQAKILRAISEPSLSHIPVYPPVPCLQNISRIFCSPHHSILVWAIILSHQNYCKVSNWSPCFYCCVLSTSSQTDTFKSSKAGFSLREKPRSNSPITSLPHLPPLIPSALLQLR